MDCSRLSRRGLILGAVASLSTASSASPVASATTSRSPTSVSPMVTRPAHELVAVRVFPSYRAGVYSQHDAVLARLGALGVRRISHKISPLTDSATIEFTRRAYHDHGIESWLTVGEPRVPLTTSQWDGIEAILSGPLANMVERCYGWNEPNHGRGGEALPDQWPQLTSAHQEQLWRRVKPLGIMIGTPQLWSGSYDIHDADLARLAPLIAGTFDHIGWHLYPRGTVGVDLLDRFEATYRRLLGDFPVVCTEAGYLDATSYTGGAANLTPAQKAELLPMLVDAYVSRGYGLSYFELLDDPDASEAGREANLGLVECQGIAPETWTNKPAFDALQAHLAQL